jgi:hypothetical protein
MLFMISRRLLTHIEPMGIGVTERNEGYWKWWLDFCGDRSSRNINIYFISCTFTKFDWQCSCSVYSRLEGTQWSGSHVTTNYLQFRPNRINKRRSVQHLCVQSNSLFNSTILCNLHNLPWAWQMFHFEIYLFINI